MVDYVQLDEEVNCVKENEKMADTIINLNGECRNTTKFVHFSEEKRCDHEEQLLDIAYNHQRLDKNMREKTVKKHWKEFISSSTMHGFHFCFDANYKFRRIIWLVLVATSIGVLLEKLHNSTIKFFEYPMSTTTTIKYVENMNFPAISICNLNDYRMSQIKDTLLHEILQEGTLMSRMGEVSGSDYASTTKNAAHRLSHMLFFCQMSQLPCAAENFTTFYQTQGEKCHTFNSGINHKIIQVSETAMRAAFDLVLNIEQYDYYDTQDAGIRVIIHDQNETPVLMQGVTISPGTTGYLAIKKKETTNLPMPYNTACADRKLKYFQHYSENTCRVERLTDYVVHECKCKDSFMPGPARVCSLQELSNCTWPKWTIFNGFKDIDCPIACHVTEFESSVSFSQFPSNKHADKIARDLNLTGNVQENRQFLRDNLLRVKIYYETMTYVYMEQTPSYDAMIFLGDIGGQLGLFLGTSILTYVEFFDYLAMVIYTKYFEIFKTNP